MQSRPSRHIVALISLLVFLLTGQAGVQGYVWCLGEDGHAALEYAEDASCAPGAAKQSQDCHDEEGASSASAEEDHCGPCLDIPASLEATSTRNQQQKDFAAPAGLPVTAQLTISPVLSQVLQSNLLAQPPPQISQTLLAHRTVVLLN